jgi:hypothetical protein
MVSKQGEAIPEEEMLHIYNNYILNSFYFEEIKFILYTLRRYFSLLECKVLKVYVSEFTAQHL